jgi:hypothetical protein
MSRTASQPTPITGHAVVRLKNGNTYLGHVVYDGHAVTGSLSLRVIQASGVVDYRPARLRTVMRPLVAEIIWDKSWPGHPCSCRATVGVLATRRAAVQAPSHEQSIRPARSRRCRQHPPMLRTETLMPTDTAAADTVLKALLKAQVPCTRKVLGATMHRMRQLERDGLVKRAGAAKNQHVGRRAVAYTLTAKGRRRAERAG